MPELCVTCRQNQKYSLKILGGPSHWRRCSPFVIVSLTGQGGRCLVALSRSQPVLTCLCEGSRCLLLVGIEYISSTVARATIQSSLNLPRAQNDSLKKKKRAREQALITESPGTFLQRKTRAPSWRAGRLKPF